MDDPQTDSTTTTSCSSASLAQRSSSQSATDMTRLATEASSSSCSSNDISLNGKPTSSVTTTNDPDTSTPTSTHSPLASRPSSTDSRGSSQTTTCTGPSILVSDHSTLTSVMSLSPVFRPTGISSSEEQDAQSTGCSAAVAGLSSSASYRASAHGQSTSRDGFPRTSSLLEPVTSSYKTCSTALLESGSLSSQAITISSTSSYSKISTSCTESSGRPSTETSSPFSTICTSTIGAARGHSGAASTTTNQTSTLCSSSTSISTSSTSISMLITTATVGSEFPTAPAVYSFAVPSLPPSYYPPLAAYGYESAPPVYGFSAQSNNGRSGSSSPSSPSAETSPVRSSLSISKTDQQSSRPDSYAASTPTVTQTVGTESAFANIGLAAVVDPDNSMVSYIRTTQQRG